MSRHPMAKFIIRHSKEQYPTVAEYYSDDEILAVVSRFGNGVLSVLQNAIYRIIDEELNHEDYPDEPFPY